MTFIRHLFAIAFLTVSTFAIAETAVPPAPTSMSGTIHKTDAEWQKILTPEQYRVLRKKGTERPFANEYANNHEHGIYKCAGCGKELFKSEAKFESGTGWPSFYEPVAKDAVRIARSSLRGMKLSARDAADIWAMSSTMVPSRQGYATA